MGHLPCRRSGRSQKSSCSPGWRGLHLDSGSTEGFIVATATLEFFSLQRKAADAAAGFIVKVHDSRFDPCIVRGAVVMVVTCRNGFRTALSELVHELLRLVVLDRTGVHVQQHKREQRCQWAGLRISIRQKLAWIVRNQKKREMKSKSMRSHKEL